MKYLFAFLIGIIFAHNILAEQINYRSDLKYKYFNDVWKKQFDQDLYLKIDSENDHLFMYIEETLGTSAVELDNKSKESLINSIEKYNAWNKKASTKGVKLDKEITKITPVWYYNKSGNKWYQSYGQDFTVQFFSQNKKIHQLVFLFPTVSARSNDYLTHTINTIYLTYKQANILRKALMEESIMKFMKKHKKNKAIEDEFK